MAGRGNVRVLDLFCGAGGAAMGLHRAWPEAEITGVDIKPQPRYPFTFKQADAMEVPLEGFDFIWASPPCQAFSALKVMPNSRNHADLLTPLRERLKATAIHYCIENVFGAPLLMPIKLCGSSFALGVRRHRYFELRGFYVLAPPCVHHQQPEPLDVTGVGGPGGRHRKPRNLDEARLAMGIDWMTRDELTQAVPPAYSEFIAKQAKHFLTFPA